jgi:fatty acid desaturase
LALIKNKRWRARAFWCGSAESAYNPAMEFITKDELAQVTRRSSWRASLFVAYDWTLIIGTFYLVSVWSNPLTWCLALLLFGARQLSLGVIVHETGHGTFYPSKAVNDFVGRWLSGYWVFSNKAGYMRVHRKHHELAGTESDPDLGNYIDYPVTRSSFHRKIWRDLSGQTGWRRLKSIGRSIRRLPELDVESQKTVRGGLIVNAALLLVLTLLGHAELFLLWLIAFMTTHMLSTRLRQMAEHAAVPDRFSSDARLNTRTLRTHWWERLLIAPHQIAFHLEHHLLQSVPIYRLPLFHQLLINNGYHRDVQFVKGFWPLIKQVTRPG